jgi:hypothetical protein
MAATTTKTAGTGVGAVIEIYEQRLGEKPRTGEILEVLGESEHEHYRVRTWLAGTSIVTAGRTFGWSMTWYGLAPVRLNCARIVASSSWS